MNGFLGGLAAKVDADKSFIAQRKRNIRQVNIFPWLSQTAK
jgi:hypothetical protein